MENLGKLEVITKKEDEKVKVQKSHVTYTPSYVPTNIKPVRYDPEKMEYEFAAV